MIPPPRPRQPSSAQLQALPSRLYAGIVVLCAGIIAYANSLHGPMIYDDLSAIVENASIRRLWPIAGALNPPHNSPVQGRPLVNATFAVNYALGGPDGLQVVGYHVFNLAVHVWASLVLFGLVRRTLRLPVTGADFRSAATPLATVIAVFWVVHPLTTEAVSYITERTESLMALAYLSTLYCVVRGAESVWPTPWYAAAVLACAAGMSSKEVMVSAPAVVLVYDRVFLSRSWRDCFRERGPLYVGLAATWGLLAALILSGEPGRGGSVGWGLGVTPWHYAMAQGTYILHYLRLCFWPSPLVIDYGPISDTTPFQTWPCAVVLGLVVVSLAAFRWRSWVGFLGLAFFAILAPTSSVLPIITEVAAERRMYLPLAAVVTLLAVGAFAGVRRLRLPTVVVVGAVVALAGTLMWFTVLRNHTYGDEVALWAEAAADRPQNPRAHKTLGEARMRVGAAHEAAGRLDQAHREYLAAEADYRRALALGYRPAETHADLGAAEVKLAESEPDRDRQRAGFDRAIEEFRQAVALEPKLARAESGWGAALQGKGDYAAAYEHYVAAVRLNPDDDVARGNLAVGEYNLGVMSVQRGEVAAARAHFEACLALKPNLAAGHYNLGVVLAYQGDRAGAREHWRRAVEIDPDHAQARAKLAAESSAAP